MRNLWQANRTNPALLPQSKVTIGLPNIYNRLYITGTTYEDLIGTNENGESTLTINEAIAQLNDENDLRESLSLETVSLGLQLGKLHASIYHAIKFDAYLQYPKTLPQLIWQGNAQFIGQDVQIGHNVQITGYHELGLGLGFQPTEHLTIGGRLKLLSGIGDASTERTSLSVYTDEDIYQLTLTADYLLNSSSFVRYNSFKDLELDFNLGKFELDKFFSGNFGIGFDLGVRYQTEKWDVAISAADIGSITWKDDAHNYELKGIYDYAGLDIAQAFLEDSISLETALDTLEEIFMIAETTNSYTTKLPAKFYLSTSFAMSEKWQLGAAFFIESYREKVFPTFTLATQHQLSNLLSLGASYSISDGTYNNVGLNAIVNLGPLQIFGVTDNIIAVFQPDKSHHLNARVGLNLLLFQGKE